MAEKAHSGQFRKSGDPYITHPLAVATILADLGMDTTTLVAALLHDTVEDTPYTLENATAEFGEEVAHLVDGVTKLDKVHFGAATEAETIRKMIIAMAQDPRVLVIKLADRLHNMRTMRFLPPDKQARKARETLEVLAPLAHRLGMATIKWELEDLAFSILHSKRYDEIVRLVADRAPSRDTYLAAVTGQLEAELSAAKISCQVVGRGKHYYSIYQKMQARGREFDEIHDLVAVRILVGNVRECYAAMGVVHALWAPMPGRFKDYIAQPRYGVYQSLHTTVIGPEGKPLEVQIRTYDMHHTAEYGIASHWRYKEISRHPFGCRHLGGRDGLDATASRLAAGGRRCRRIPGQPALRDGAQRDLRVHPEGRHPHAASGFHSGRLRLCGAHRGRPPVHRGQGGRPVGAVGAAPVQRAVRGDLHLQGAQSGTEPGLAGLRRVLEGEDQDPPVLRQVAPRGGRRARQGGHRQGRPPGGTAGAAADLARGAGRHRT